MFVLVVTWFYFNQPPTIYQSAFASSDLCESAKAAVLADAQRLKDAAIAGSTQRRSDGSVAIFSNPIYPTASAICQKQN